MKIGTVNDAGGDGVLGNSALAVILGKTGNLTGTLEYTGTTTGSSKPFTLATGGTGVFQIDAVNTNLTLSAVIGGGGALTKTGAGTLSLAGANTFTGTLTVEQGVLKVGTVNDAGTDGVLGNSALAVVLGKSAGAGTLEYTGATATSSKPFTLTTGGTGVFQIDAGTTNLALGGLIDGGALSKTGPGTLTLNGGLANTFSGGFSVSHGTLALDLSNMEIPADLVAGTNTLAIGGILAVKGKSGGVSTSQTLGNVTATVGSAAKILIDPNTGTDTTLALGWLGTAANAAPPIGSTLLVGKSAIGTATITTTSNPAFQNGWGRVLYTSDGGTTVDFVTKTGSTLVPVTSFTASPASGSTFVTTNAYQITGSETRAAATGPGVLKIVTSGAGQSLDLGGYLYSCYGGLLVTGSHGYEIKNGTMDSPVTGGGKAITLQQYNTGGLTISAVIQDTPSRGAVTLTKGGPETLILSGVNRWSGITYITEGTVSVTTISNGGTTRSVTTTGDSPIVTLASGTTDGLSIGQVINCNSGSGASYIPQGRTIQSIENATQFTLNDGTNVAATSNTSATIGTANSLGIASAAAVNIQIGNGTLQYTGADAITDRAFTIAVGRSATFDITASHLTMAGATGTATTGGLTKTGGGTLTLTGTNTYSGATTINGGTLTIGGGGKLGSGTYAGNMVVAGGAAFSYQSSAAQTMSGVISGAGALNHAGSGTLTLAGLNTYSGNTTVNNGTLVLADNAGLKFVVTNASSNRLNGAGTVTLDGDFTIDTVAVSNTSGSWTLVDVTTLAATFGSTFSVAGWSETAKVWTKNESGGTWTFTEATGVLALTGTGGSGYDLWASTPPNSLSGGNAAFDFDYDNDGIDNGLEWILGGDPTRNDTPSILPAATGSAATGLTLVFNRGNSSVVGSTLVVEWGGDPGTLSNILVIGTTDVPVNGNHPSVDIDAPATDQVTVHIPAANAVAGKLFARLKATRN